MNATLSTSRRPGMEAWARRTSALVVAAVAAYSSYAHQRAFALDGGADPVAAALWPLSVDGLVILATLGLVHARRHTDTRTRAALWLAFIGGIAASLAANIDAAPQLNWQSILVAGWPPLALLLAVELVLHAPARVQVAEPTPPVSANAPPANAGLACAPSGETGDVATAATADGRPANSHLALAADRTAEITETSDGAGRQSVSGRAALHALAGRTTDDPRPGAEAAMWAHFEAERRAGRTPTGAELDRVAGTNNYGRAVLARWRRNGRIPPASPPPVTPDRLTDGRVTSRRLTGSADA